MLTNYLKDYSPLREFGKVIRHSFTCFQRAKRVK